MTDGSRTWLITGASRGLGQALAEEVLSRGERAIATFRKPDQVAAFDERAPGRSFGCLLDLADHGAIAPAIEAAVARAGRLDVLVNNAAYGLQGAVEEVSDADIRHQMETNFFGPLATIRAVLPLMRAQRSGWIVNVTSVGGFVANPGLGIYHASKFALDGLTESLRKEVAPLGITAMIVAPGGMRTDWAGDSMTFGGAKIDDYADTAGKTMAGLRRASGHQKGDPRRTAQAIIACIDSGDAPLRLVLGDEALASFRRQLALHSADADRWEALARSTYFPD